VLSELPETVTPASPEANADSIPPGAAAGPKPAADTTVTCWVSPKLLGSTLKRATRLADPSVAVMDTVSGLFGEVVVTENVPEVDPAATITVEGTWALAPLLVRETWTPPVAAGPLRAIEPVVVFPPMSVSDAT
jgi:hypothetical protein